MKSIKLFFAVLLFSFSAVLASAQNIKITGTVSDATNGEPIPYASVAIKGLMTVVETDENGHYSISASSDATLVFSFIGFHTLEIPVKGQLVLNAAMQPEAIALDNVVVVAYGVATKESLTGAVSSVSSKSIEKRPVSNVVSALEGMTSGVQINNTIGEPGSSPTIRIRGFSTINGSNSPLYVVDGVPLSGNTSDLNANDIESMSILKDAASSALYGNRASNGVVLITTKRGKNEKFSVRGTVQQGVYTRGIKEYERLDPNDWMETQWKAIRNSLLSDPAQASKYPTLAAANAQANIEIFDQIGYNIYNKPNDALFDANGKLAAGAAIKQDILGDLDWYDPIERVGYRQEYNISSDGATKMLNYFFSVNYLSEDGYVKTSDFQRFTGRANVSIQPRKWIKMGLNLSGSHRVSNLTSFEGSTSYINPFYFARNMAPIYPVHAHDLSSETGAYILDEEGNQIYDWGQYSTRPQNNGRNVAAELEWNMNKYYRNTLDGQAYVDIMFLKDFKFTLKGQLYNSNSENRSYDNSIVGDGAGSNGRAKRELYRYKNYTIQEQLSWSKDFGKHNVDVLVGHENYATRYNYLYMYKTGETFANKVDMINFSELTRGYDYENNYRTEGYIARAKYNFDNKYYVEGSYRRDGSSRFYHENRWGNFWSAGGSWIISREKWMMKLKDQINSLKLRASYGEVGNDQSVGMYGYMALYALTTNGILPAAYKSQNEALDIQWESTNSFGVALEGRFFNLFNLSVEYFDKRSKDLLFDVYLPLSSGSTSTSSATATVTKNLGTISNRGWELNFDIDPITTKDWRWNIGFNATFLKNKILTLPEQNRKDGIISGTKKYVEGGGIFDYWLYQFEGVDQMTGNSLFLINDENYYGTTPPTDPEDVRTQVPAEYLVTINGKDYTTYTTYAKQDWSGTALPTVYGSFNTSLSWKNLSFSALFTYSLGGKTYDNSYSSLMTVSSSPYAIHKDILKSWDGVPAGMTETSANRIDPNGIPVVDGYRNTYTSAGSSNRWLQNSNYLVIKNISLSYTLPERLCRKMDLSGLNFVFSIENLATFNKIQGMDPQQAFSGVISNNFTTARTFSLGVNITL